MENKGFLKKDSTQQGQSTVEYILILAVVSTLSITLMRSDYITRLLSEDGALSQAIKGKIEYSYRNAGSGSSLTPINPSYNSSNHPSYSSGSGTRFFAPSEPYPQGF